MDPIEKNKTVRVSIMQPYIFPYLGYFQMIQSVDRFVLLDDVQYIKKGWINKNRILMNGNDTSFVFPIKNASSHLNINDRFFSDFEEAKEKLIKTLCIAYRKAPFFELLMPKIRNMIYFDSNNVAVYIEHQIREICKLLEINTEILLSSNINKNIELKKQELMIDICKQCHGKVYINAIGGQQLYSKEDFIKSGIKLFFIQMDSITYRQFQHPFVDKLSILDVLLFNGCERTKEMLEKYKLI